MWAQGKALIMQGKYQDDAVAAVLDRRQTATNKLKVKQIINYSVASVQMQT